MNRFSLEGKIALITGSTQGIGAVLARAFAEAGARVWVHGRNVAAGERLATEIGGVFFQADFAVPAQVDALVNALKEHEQRLDVLVNNAGIEIIAPLSHLNLADYDLTHQVNVRAAVQLTRGLFFLLQEAARRSGDASVINVTSIHDTTPYPHNLAYSMSKAALAMLTKVLAIELSSQGIRVNNLAPGAVETEINRDVIEAMGRENFARWIPAGRVAQSEELIGPALFLASTASSYVTGATLYADGGYRQNLVRYRP